MFKKALAIAILCLVVLLPGQKSFAQNTHYRVVRKFPVGGSGGWDYIAFHNNRLYVSHSTKVIILNAANGDSTGVIDSTTGIHGVAFAPGQHKGYTSNGRLNNVFVFNENTNRVIKTIETEQNPDAIFYEDYSKKIITCNGGGKSLSVIDPVTDAIVATIPLGGKPEEAVSDGKGKVFVNIEDKNEIAVVDIKEFKVLKRWPITPGESASGLKMDRKTNRLFAGCENEMMVVVNAGNGKVITHLPIGKGCDGLVFDDRKNLIFTSNGEGTITVIKEENADKYRLVQTVTTIPSARTCTIDPESGTLYLPAAQLAPPDPKAPNERRKIVPGTFQVLVVKE
jgi:YVTN family beta-propeller protein